MDVRQKYFTIILHSEAAISFISRINRSLCSL
jgi:hypothetical protein